MFKPIVSLFFFVALFFVQTAKAQSLEPTVIASDGGFAVLPSGTIAWTIGETVTETFTGTGNILTQGFHQPSSINLNGVGGVPAPGMSVYPNPAAEGININLTHLAAGEYTVQLFDVLGNKVAEVTAYDNTIVFLPLTEFANGVYMLTVSSVSFSQSFQVIKSE